MSAVVTVPGRLCSSASAPRSAESERNKVIARMEKLRAVRAQLSALKPEFFSVTYGAGGSTRARTVYRVVLPAAKTGIITAVILGIARVIGETAPLLLAAGYADSTNVNPIGGPIAAIPTYIFNNVALPYPDAVARAWASALVLIIIVAILFTAARLIGRNRVGSKR